jgi:hypothetical protein
MVAEEGLTVPTEGGPTTKSKVKTRTLKTEGCGTPSGPSVHLSATRTEPAPDGVAVAVAIV